MRLTGGDGGAWRATSPSAGLSRVEKRRVRHQEFVEILEQFTRLFLASFPRDERRRIGPANAALRGDDGRLPGPAIEELVTVEHFHLVGYFDGGCLVGFTASFDLGTLSLGDYLVRDPARSDLTGLGVRMLDDWLDEAMRRHQDAVIEVEPLVSAPDASEPSLEPDERARRRAIANTRRRRLRMFERRGFEFPNHHPYWLPGGPRMSLGIRRPPEPRDCEGCGLALTVEELTEIASQLRATYEPEVLTLTEERLPPGPPWPEHQQQG